MNLTHLETGELLRLAYVELHALSSTSLERELLRRLEKGAAAPREFARVLSEYGLDDDEDRDQVAQLGRALEWETDWDPKVYRPLLEVMSEKDIDSAQNLRELLARLTELERQITDGELITNPETNT